MSVNLSSSTITKNNVTPIRHRLNRSGGPASLLDPSVLTRSMPEGHSEFLFFILRTRKLGRALGTPCRRWQHQDPGSLALTEPSLDLGSLPSARDCSSLLLRNKVLEALATQHAPGPCRVQDFACDLSASWVLPRRPVPLRRSGVQGRYTGHRSCRLGHRGRAGWGLSEEGEVRRMGPARH